VSLLFKRKHIAPTLNVSSKEGFEWLYNTYWEKVFAVCYHGSEDVHLAKEMTQDIFKSIWERRETLVIEKSYEHYLVRSAKLKVAEHFRNQASRKKHLNNATKDFCEAANCTEQDVCYSMLVEELDLLVDQLPCQCRNVFNMSRNQGMTNKEIAEKLQISQRAVEYHISKALTFLKKNMKEHGV
jgi:RNA polymerase sigma-70 factor (ECF subfamily)